MKNDTEYKELYKKAINAGRARNYTKAVKLLTKIVTNTDGFPHALLYLGRSYHALGNFNKAIQMFEFYKKAIPKENTGLFFLGRTYLTIGKYKKAIINLKASIKTNPDFFPALSLIALSYLKLKRPEASLIYFEKALEIEPDNKRIYIAYLNALLVKAMRLFHKNKLKESEEIFNFINEKNQGNILPHLYLGRIYREMGRDDLSLEQYTIASQISPEDPVLPVMRAIILFRLGNSEQAYKELKRSAELSNEDVPIVNDPELLTQFATLAFFRQKRFYEAIEHGKKILRKNYKDPFIHAIIAESYYYLKEYSKSKNHYQRCLEIDKDKIEYNHGLALTLWELKDFEELLYVIKHLKKINPKDSIAAYFNALCLSELSDSLEEKIKVLQHEIKELGPDLHLMFALGKAYFLADMLELSEGWFLRVLKLDKKHKDSINCLINIYEILKKAKKLRDYYCIFLEYYPEEHKFRHNLIKILMNLGEFKKASLEILILIPHESKNISLKKHLAYCYLKSKKFNESALLYRELLRDDPKSISLLRALIFCLDGMKSYIAAIALLEKAKKIINNKVSLLLPLGVLYSKQKMYEKAKKIFREVISLSSKDWRAYQNLGILYKRMGQKDMADQFLNRSEKYKKLK